MQENEEQKEYKVAVSEAFNNMVETINNCREEIHSDNNYKPNYEIKEGSLEILFIIYPRLWRMVVGL